VGADLGCAADASALFAHSDRRLEVLPATRALHRDRARRVARPRGDRVLLDSPEGRRVSRARASGVHDPRGPAALPAPR